MRTTGHSGEGVYYDIENLISKNNPCIGLIISGVIGDFYFQRNTYSGSGYTSNLDTDYYLNYIRNNNYMHYSSYPHFDMHKNMDSFKTAHTELMEILTKTLEFDCSFNFVDDKAPPNAKIGHRWYDYTNVNISWNPSVSSYTKFKSPTKKEIHLYTLDSNDVLLLTNGFTMKWIFDDEYFSEFYSRSSIILQSGGIFANTISDIPIRWYTEI